MSEKPQLDVTEQAVFTWVFKSVLPSVSRLCSSQILPSETEDVKENQSSVSLSGGIKEH